MDLTLTAQGMGDVPEGGLFGPARVWMAVTPYVTPRWRLTKTGREWTDFTTVAQLRKDVAAEGLPEPKSVTWKPTRWQQAGMVLVSDFIMERRGGENSGLKLLAPNLK